MAFSHDLNCFLTPMDDFRKGLIDFVATGINFFAGAEFRHFVAIAIFFQSFQTADRVIDFVVFRLLAGIFSLLDKLCCNWLDYFPSSLSSMPFNLIQSPQKPTKI
jgi:hypothetical protein